jgi:hypothetical protein
VKQVTADTNRLVQQRFLLPDSAHALVTAAKDSNVLQ